MTSVEIDYEQWGLLFFDRAVTAERVLTAVNVLGGQKIDVGPMGVGPGRIAKVTARGVIGTATGERVAGDPVSFAVTLPVGLTFTLDLGVDVHRFDAQLSVPLHLVARAMDDLRILIDVTPPQPAEVGVRLNARGIRASITKHAAGVDGELRRFVAKYVAREIEKPYVIAARTIDVSGAIDRALTHLAPRFPGNDQPLVADLPVALAEEILRQDEIYNDPDFLKESKPS